MNLHLMQLNVPTANLSLLFRHGNFMFKSWTLNVIFVLVI